MNTQQFITACKEKGVNVLGIADNKKSTTVWYNYDLPNNKLSDKRKKTFTYPKPAFQAIYNEHFSNADKLVRF